MLRAVRRLWSGDLPVDEAFWTYAAGLGLAINASSSLAFLVLISADHPILALLTGYGLSIPYNVVALVGVWRSADRVEAGDRSRAEVFRFVTLAGMLILTVT